MRLVPEPAPPRSPPASPRRPAPSSRRRSRKRRPVRRRPLRRPHLGPGRDRREHRLGRRRPDAGQEPQHPEPRHPVARVLRQPQHRHQVLDVRRLEELQPAELHERDVPPHQLDLQRPAVVRGAEEHRLRLQRHPRAPAPPAPRRRRSPPAPPRRSPSPAAAAPADLRSVHSSLANRSPASPITAFAAARIGARRAVVALERHHPRRRLEPPGKVEDVAHLRRPEPVDRLRVVAHHRHAPAVGLQRRRGSPPAAGWCPGTRRPAHGRTPPRARPPPPGRRASRPSRAAGRRSRARAPPASPRRSRRRAP